MLYDLAIVGGGLAASAALIALGESKRRIAVVRPPSGTDFKIGETLSPAANRELLALGIDPEQLAGSCQPSRSKFSSWGQGHLKETYEWRQGAQTGWCLDRRWFEDLLWQKAQETDFLLLEDTVLNSHPEDDHWKITTRDGRDIRAKRLLDVSGRAAVVVRNHANRLRHDKLVCRYEVLTQTDPGVEPTRTTLIEPVPDGWYYSVLLPDGRLLIAFFTDSDLPGVKDNWSARITSTNFTEQRVITAGFQLTGSPLLADAGTLTVELPQTGKLLAAGDAYACFDPLSSHGMTTALWAGRRIGSALSAPDFKVAGLLKGFLREYQEGVSNYLREQSRIYGLEQRFSGEVFWRRRI